VFYSYGHTIATSTRDFKKGRMLKWMFSRKHNSWKWRELNVTTKPRARVWGKELVVTFVNHATLLIQTEGKNILTDPVWSKRVSPFSFMGPVRFQLPGVSFDDLPSIDMVLISHNHYDHMDLATLRRITLRWDPPIVAGLGNAEYLRVKGFSNVRELDWWDKTELDAEVTVVCAPGQHFSSRALSDRNNTLWCGFIIETPNGAIYFAGDTGYGEFVKRIGERYKEFRLALLPIGAFRPEWFMGPVHISPEEAVQIYDELDIKTAIGIHHSTFHLADDGQDEPKECIERISAERKGSGFDFRVPKNGEVFTVQ
jgi:L-ascorbate metabolism protein UlaG (beta-lactamase superfamily)